ncbi:GAF domain-containing protein [Methanoregula sp. UBA64]|jgi:hypothetical protein|uniref:GAF domain-containing protein n=1 Tax=Methanoregula sp. UBA64 TaxID=1915554 RepID=UPI0025E569AE|nr:GAF domain-containing protein [Methanoregula sp. UBA64]
MSPRDPEKENLSETEQLIVSYLAANPPEEGMLDKIALGTGKSRATVLKYLNALHDRGVLCYRIIGRNKLWTVKNARAQQLSPLTGSPAAGIAKLAFRAFELHAALLHRAGLEAGLDIPGTVVFTILDDTTIVVKNRPAESLFPDATSLNELLCPRDAALLAAALNGKRGSEPVRLELSLKEQTGVLRRYRLTFFFPPPAGPSGCIAAIGENPADMTRTTEDLASLLYIIRAAGATRTEDALLSVAMKGIRERLVPFRAGLVFLDDMRVAYADRRVPAAALPGLTPLVKRCRDSLTTIAIGKDDPAYPALTIIGGGEAPAGALVVPVIDGEEATGAFLLLTDTEVTAKNIGNVEIVADEIAGNLKLQRLDRERSEYVNTLLAQTRLSAILNDERDEDALLSKSIQAVMDTLGFEMGCVYLKNEKDDMVTRVKKNMPENLEKMCVSGVFDSLFGQAFANKAVVYLTPESPAFAGLDPAVQKSGVRTILIIPIRNGDTVEGLLNMGSPEERPYLPASLDTLATLGLQLGTALERSRFARALEGRTT